MLGLLALLIPSRAHRHPLTDSAHWLCLAVLLWQVACYIATAVAAAGMAIPTFAEFLGLLDFELSSPAVAHLLAQLAVAMILAATSRSRQYSHAPEHDSGQAATAATAVGALQPLPTLHDSIASYWHHGRWHSLSHDQQPDVNGAPNGSSHLADAPAESLSPSGAEQHLAPIRTRAGPFAPANSRQANLVSSCNGVSLSVLLVLRFELQDCLQNWLANCNIAFEGLFLPSALSEFQGCIAPTMTVQRMGTASATFFVCGVLLCLWLLDPLASCFSLYVPNYTYHFENINPHMPHVPFCTKHPQCHVLGAVPQKRSFRGHG